MRFQECYPIMNYQQSVANKNERTSRISEIHLRLVCSTNQVKWPNTDFRSSCVENKWELSRIMGQGTDNITTATK